MKKSLRIFALMMAALTALSVMSVTMNCLSTIIGIAEPMEIASCTQSLIRVRVIFTLM